MSHMSRRFPIVCAALLAGLLLPEPGADLRLSLRGELIDHVFPGYSTGKGTAGK
jgi:hypothetical protein